MRRMAERTGAGLNSGRSENKAAQYHVKKSLEAKEEMLQEERRTSKRKIDKLEDTIRVLQEERRTSGKKIEELDNELLVKTATLKTERQYLESERKKSNKVSEKLAKLEKEFKEFERYNDTEQFNAEADTRRLEEKLREPAATRKDVHEVISSQLSSQFTRWKEEFSKERERLKTENAALCEKLKHALSERKSKCQEDAQNCKLIRNNWKRLQDAFENAEDCGRGKDAYIEKVLKEMEILKDKAYAARLSSRVCQQCAVLTNKVSVLEEQLDKQTTQLRGCSKKSTSLQQSDLCEELHIEYGKLVTGFEMLKLVECHFNDSFEAKGFICDIFIDSYAKCKECLMEIICKNLGELFQVQTEDHRNDAMEDLSHAFWQLLQTTGMKLLLTKEQVVSDLHKRVKEDIPKLQRLKKAEGDIAAATEKLPLDQFVKLAWKFVTQPYPVIVCTPVKCKMDNEIHKSSFSRWDEERDGERPVIYSQPVVYRSYHGEVLVKGLVGNVP